MNSSAEYIFEVVNGKQCLQEETCRNGAVVDEGIYEEIVDAGKSDGKKRTVFSNDRTTLFSISPQDTAVETIFAVLSREGVTPKFQHCLPARDSEKYFTVRTSWEPGRKQLNEAEYFQITNSLYDSSNLGKLLGMDPDHVAHVVADKEQWKRKQELAEIGDRLFIASDGFRQRFEEAKLVGLKLNELQWYYQAPGFGWDEVDAIDDPNGRKWVTSSVVMPPCLTLRRYTDGPHVGEIVKDKKPAQHHRFDSEGLAPAVLRFKRSDVEKLGRFDVAITSERTHQTQEYLGPNAFPPFRDTDYWLPDIIVSRRFKAWLSNSGMHGCKRVQYRLVELV